MRTATAFSAIYLVSASFFSMAIVVQHHPVWPARAYHAGHSVVARIRNGANTVNERAIQPAIARVTAWDRAFFNSVYPHRHTAVASKATRKLAHVVPAPVAKLTGLPALRPAIVERERIARVVGTPPKTIASPRSALTLAPASAPRPDLTAPSSAELARVMVRLKDNLTPEMLDNFGLFLYVSKAENGPLAQRMYVFRKRSNGDLDLLHDWPVSTGRELVEFAPNGRLAPSFTPRGYYELDPDRMYKHHVSGQWKTPMPYAMFFNWEKNGLQTGLAIHSATGDDIAQLGKRASAGCVRLAPEHAAQLFHLIRTHYQGLAPRFAYDRRTATMSNDGLLMHDAEGRVRMAEGYKVLVFIENYGGGDNVVAALF